MAVNSLPKDSIRAFSDKADYDVELPRMRHQSIRWILIALLLIIGIWGTILLIAYFITAPSFNDVKNLLSNQQDWVETYTQLVEAHNRQFASLAQVTLILIVPVFSTLAGSYIRGNITTV